MKGELVTTSITTEEQFKEAISVRGKQSSISY
jgi:hypothetical protein